MNRTPLLLAFIGGLPFGGPLSLLLGQTPSAGIEQQVRSQYPIASVGSNGVVVRAGTVLVVQQDGIIALPAPAEYTCNSHKEGGRISHPALCVVNNSPNKDMQRPLQVGEKAYLTAIQVKPSEVVFRVQTSDGVPFRTAVSFQFQKGYLDSVNAKQIQDRIGQIFAIDTGISTEGSIPQAGPARVEGGQSLPTPPVPPAPAAPLKLPSTYFSAQAQADQLRLNADNSFSLQEAGQTYHGTFVINGNTLELSISETNTKTTVINQGSNLTDGNGQTWVLREQPTRSAPGAGVLQNQDIIKMAKAGFGDDLILLKIGSSKCQFDTSPEALIQLKQEGVSAAVIKAMVVGPGSFSSPPSPAPPVSNPGSDLPAAYGYYVVDNGQYRDLKPTTVSVVVGVLVRVTGDGIAVDGVLGNAPQAFDTNRRSFLVYQQTVDIAGFHLAKLEFVRNMQASQFNMTSLNAQVFQGVYGVDYNQNVAVNLWRAQEQEVPLRTEPVAGRNGMFRLTPDTALAPGRYVLYSGQALHKSDMIFATRSSTSTNSVFYFEIR